MRLCRLSTTASMTLAETMNDDGMRTFIIINPLTGNHVYRMFKP
jgi:hypothetical protein